jgi:hypothetical protein
MLRSENGRFMIAIEGYWPFSIGGQAAAGLFDTDPCVQ